MKDVHIMVDEQLYEDIVRYFPEHGARTIMVRRMLRKLVAAYKQKKVAEDFYDITAKEEIVDALRNGVIE